MPLRALCCLLQGEADVIDPERMLKKQETDGVPARRPGETSPVNTQQRGCKVRTSPAKGKDRLTGELPG
jgi:hypothetical protein